MGRSGTTLLTNMLNSHANIVACPENEFIIFLQQNFKNEDFSNPKVVDSFLGIFNLEYNRVLSFWKPDLNVLRQDIEKLEIKSFENVCKLVYMNYPFAEKNKNDVSCIVDKNPIHSLYLNELQKLFPDAKYIILSRDYRDNIVSRKTYSDKNSSILKLAVAWNYFYQQIAKSVKSNDLNVSYLRYEDLVSNPEDELMKLCDFLQVEYQNSMLEFQTLSKKIKSHIKESASAEKYEKISSMHQNLEKKVSSDRVGSFDSRLTKNEIAVLNFICKNEAKKIGYLNLIEDSSINLRQKAVLQFYRLYIPLFYNLEKIKLKLPLKIKKILLRKKQ